MAATDLLKACEAAGIDVRADSGWESRGGSWLLRNPFKAGTIKNQPIAIMHHHTAPPVPYPIPKLNGTSDGLIKCNMNTKPDGTLWLVAYKACNYSSGKGSSVVLKEMKSGTPPTKNALERNLVDDTYGNKYFWNFENDHPGDGSKIPDDQLATIITSSIIVINYFEIQNDSILSHSEWTRRKRDPYWNSSLRAIEEIRRLVEESMITRNSKVDEGDPRLASDVELMRSLGVMSEHTQPGGLAINDEVAHFMVELLNIVDAKIKSVTGSTGVTLNDVKDLIRQSKLNPPA